MSEIEISNIQLYPEEALAALDRLEHIATIALAGRAHTVEKALHLVPNRHAVFSGTFEGAPVVFRLALSDKARETSAREWAELSRVWPYMSEPPLTVQQPLFFDEATGLTVTALAKGEGLLTALWRLAPQDRAVPIALSADWLRKYTAPSEEWRETNRRPWRKWAEQAVGKQPHESLADIEGRIFHRMKKLHRQIDFPEWRVALAHGDFHLNNLFWNGTGLTGLDLGATNHAPLYKDIARALVHMARRGMLPSGSRRFGVDADAFETFSARFELNDQEKHGYLPYFICFETLIKVEHPKMPQARIDHAMAMSKALLEDLKQIT
ncbi:aminoglycoside phosphotransferase family protein [Lentibacter sp. XHP0401]|uniref:aminoglycoside phosphotransferase family protein n=1 Tax=Lentibacter sp. XHP0401 TaxID=2984334 RepID=UPI0021E82A96|nr:aminoglycoside phosphotransferase family protein [Lentibacter sp. XHP0401]MCV2892508.1 aminoglycoside phosphotransferase family protein [Lentibacter sp. XHP0401]